jgi:hypothetical protein
MLAVTGRAGGFAVPDVVGVADGDFPVPEALGLAEAVDAVGSADPSDLKSAGMAISAPITMNTVAMMTLGNCIPLSSRRTPSGWPMILDHS